MTGTTKLLLSAAAGVVVCLLVAPKKGEELRNDITDTAGKLKNQLGRLVGRANGRLEDFKTYLDKHVDGLSDDVKRKVIEVIDNAEGATNTARKRLSDSISY